MYTWGLLIGPERDGDCAHPADGNRLGFRPLVVNRDDFAAAEDEESTTAAAGGAARACRRRAASEPTAAATSAATERAINRFMLDSPSS